MKSTVGFTLLEVLISIFLLSLGMLAFVSTQNNFLHKTRNNLNFQQATMFAENMAVYLRSHRGDGSGYLAEWHKQIKTSLPNAAGKISLSDRQANIQIIWGRTRKGTPECVTLNLKM